MLDRPIFLEQIEGYRETDDPNQVYLLRKAGYGLKQSARCWNLDIDRILRLLGFIPVHGEPCLYVLRHDPRTPSTQEGVSTLQNDVQAKSADVFAGDHSFDDEFEEFDFDLLNLSPFETITCLLTIWVDDIILTGPNPEILAFLVSALNRRFPLTDGGDLTHILGIEISRTPQGIHLTQRGYIDEVLKRFNHADCHAEATPLDPSAISTLLPRDDVAPATERGRYQELSGSLNYLSIRTQPDISTAVAFLSRFNHNPAPPHWAVLKRVLRYLRGTADHGLFYPRAPQKNDQIYVETNVQPVVKQYDVQRPYLLAFSDSDWAQSVDRTSISGYVLQFGVEIDVNDTDSIKTPRATISSSSKKQSCLGRSSTEAEIIAGSDAARDIAWIRQVSEEKNPVPLLLDNHGAIDIAKDTRRVPRRSKHIDLRDLYIGDAVATHKISVSSIPSRDNLADIMTKGLPRIDFERHRHALGVIRCP